MREHTFTDPLAGDEFLTRADGRVEWVCDHGVGHTIDAPPAFREIAGEDWSVHGCDGCCSTRKAGRVDGT